MNKENKRTVETDIEVYGKLLDYKRGVGSTQWTILSLFITASGGILVYSLSATDRITGIVVRVLGLAVYWLGYALYDRYYKMNGFVAEYLVELEKTTGYEFQQHLNSRFHSTGISTQRILLIGGFLYLAFSVVASFLPVATKASEVSK
jgi:hypothetical protein